MVDRFREVLLYIYDYLLFSFLATFKVISGWVATCDSAHSWWLYSAVKLGNQTASTMTWYPTQSHYLDTELTSPCHILLVLSTRLESDKYQFNKSLVWLDQESNSQSPHMRPALYRFSHCALCICLSSPVFSPWPLTFVYITSSLRGWGRSLSWLRHWVGDPGESGTNPITATTFSCVPIHFPTVHNLQRHKRQIPLTPCLYGVGG